jgi:GMP synthase (glutamine-hydrolysing)
MRSHGIPIFAVGSERSSAWHPRRFGPNASGMSKVAAAIRHIAFEDLGSLSEVLEEHGYRYRYLEAGVDALDGAVAREADLLIVLGGPISAYEEHLYPFLSDELALLERRLADDRPTLGICLGAQLMARALGARVYAGGKKEIGFFPITLSELGEAGPLGALRCPVLHWHGDTFDLPAGAVHLASSELYRQQAFRWKTRGLALQFHVEAMRLERWFIGHAGELAATGIDVRELRAAAARHATDLEHAGRRALGAWLGTLA